MNDLVKICCVAVAVLRTGIAPTMAVDEPEPLKICGSAWGGVGGGGILYGQSRQGVMTIWYGRCGSVVTGTSLVGTPTDRLMAIPTKTMHSLIGTGVLVRIGSARENDKFTVHSETTARVYEFSAQPDGYAVVNKNPYGTTPIELRCRIDTPSGGRSN